LQVGCQEQQRASRVEQVPIRSTGALLTQRTITS
jgi:hypothetical protein